MSFNTVDLNNFKYLNMTYKSTFNKISLSSTE